MAKIIRPAIPIGAIDEFITPPPPPWTRTIKRRPGEGMARLPAAVRENEPALIPPRSLPLFGEDQRPDAWGGGGNRAYNQISFQIRVVFPPSLSGSMFNRTWQVQCDWISRGKECWSWVSRRSVCGEGENTTPLKTPACSGRLLKTMAGEKG